jgi:hypothetical protein
VRDLEFEVGGEAVGVLGLEPKTLPLALGVLGWEFELRLWHSECSVGSLNSAFGTRSAQLGV